MKNKEIYDLLGRLSLISPELWKWNGWWETELNGATISMVGGGVYGWTYHIQIDGVDAYHGGNEFEFFRVFNSPIDKKIDSICRNLYMYHREYKNNRVVDKIKEILND